MIIVLLLARIDKRSNSAPKLPLISEFFFAGFVRFSCTALLLMLTTLFLMIIVFIPLTEFYKSALVRM